MTSQALLCAWTGTEEKYLYFQLGIFHWVATPSLSSIRVPEKSNNPSSWWPELQTPAEAQKRVTSPRNAGPCSLTARTPSQPSAAAPSEVWLTHDCGAAEKQKRASWIPAPYSKWLGCASGKPVSAQPFREGIKLDNPDCMTSPSPTQKVRKNTGRTRSDFLT